MPRTLDEVGKCYHFSRERVRQVEAKALRKLRHPTRSRCLESYADEIEYDTDPYEKL